MEKRAIVMQGVGKTGKTTTARMIIQKLLDCGFKMIDCDNPRKEPKDMRVLLKKGEVLLAVCTAGDSEKIVNNNLKYIKEKDCKYAILFSRTGENTKGVLAIKDFFKNKNVIWNSRWCVNYSGSYEKELALRSKVNYLQATEIVEVAKDYFGF